MANNKGTVIQVMGPVLDIRFADNQLPQLLSAIEVPNGEATIVAEVTEDNAAVVAHIFAVISKVTKQLGLESYRVVSNIGEQAGQSVHHLHFHVLSGRDMTWPPG